MYKIDTYITFRLVMQTLEIKYNKILFKYSCSLLNSPVSLQNINKIFYNTQKIKDRCRYNKLILSINNSYFNLLLISWLDMN